MTEKQQELCFFFWPCTCFHGEMSEVENQSKTKETLLPAFRQVESRFFSCTSEANRPKIICREIIQWTAAGQLTPALPKHCYWAPQSLPLLSPGAKIQNMPLSVDAGPQKMASCLVHGVLRHFVHDAIHGHLSNIHITDSEKGCEPHQKPPRGEQKHWIDPLPVWVQQSMRLCVCLTNCDGGFVCRESLRRSSWAL